MATDGALTAESQTVARSQACLRPQFRRDANKLEEDVNTKQMRQILGLVARNRWYVGCSGAERETFRAASTPTRESHGAEYAAVIGPFVTRHGAEYMAQYGVGNPHLQHVNDAERIAKLA